MSHVDPRYKGRKPHWRQIPVLDSEGRIIGWKDCKLIEVRSIYGKYRKVKQ